MKKLWIVILNLFTILTAHSQQTLRTNSIRLLNELNENKKLDVHRIAVLIKLAQFYADSTESIEPDTAEFFLKQAQSLNNRLHFENCQNTIDIIHAELKCRVNPKVNAKDVLTPLINTCKKKGDINNEWLAWKYMGDRAADDLKNATFRQNCYQNALNLLRSGHDPESECELLRKLSDIHMQQHHYLFAENELLQTLRPGLKVSHRSYLFSCDLITHLYISKGEYNKALYYAFKTQRAMQSEADSVNAITFYTRLNLIYRELGNNREALAWGRKAYEFSVRRKNNLEYLVNLRGLILGGLINEGQPQKALQFLIREIDKHKPISVNDRRSLLSHFAFCYNALKEYALAEKYYKLLDQLVNAEGDKLSPFEKAISYLNIGKFYLFTNRQKIAKPYLLKALKSYELIGDVKTIQDMSLLLFKADSASANYISAIGYLQRSDKLKDSIFKADKNRQVEELQIAYDTEQKIKKIRDLQNTAKLQKLNLQDAKSTRNWIICGSCMLIVIAGLLYRQSRLARTSNEVISRKNIMLEQLVVEKEWLLKEVHHRVKNNLHTVICLLESQALYLQDDALKAIESCQHRIFAMSLIHQKLYRSDDIKTIDMTEYIPELVQNLQASFGIAENISFQLDIDPITLGVSYAIPFGLIINEAVTNSIKYAFPQRTGGNIYVSLTDNDEEIKLVIADNGIGMQKAPDHAEYQSLGVELMQGLCGDIGAGIRFEISGGTRIIIEFTPATLSDTVEIKSLNYFKTNS